MNSVRFPIFGMASQLPQPKDLTTFADFGFLSNEAESMRWSGSTDTSAYLELVKTAVCNVHADLQILHGSPIAGSEWPALGLWERTLEACQGAAMLADRGMVPSAIALLRTGYECLFFTCALWREKNVLDRMENKHTSELFAMAKRLKKEFFPDELSPEVWEMLQSHAVEPKGSQISAFEAAEIADMKKAYASVWAGLSTLGTHATTRSLHSYAPQVKGEEFHSTVGPKFTDANQVFNLAHACLRMGQQHFRAHFTQFTFGPPISDRSPEERGTAS
ncbi:DUF5677 domain-containing protein [Acidovorax sp. NPDC077693]|uniref:DUF5677 domain-containing protein n=1 Tax=unclassified Acidovorax TaxID=2684926 RepID=UPI0037C6CC43